jgi:hypothetical protein
VLEMLEKFICEVDLNSDGEFIRSGSYIYEIFSSVNIDQESAETVTEIVEQSIAVLTEQHISGNKKIIYGNAVESGGVLSDTSLSHFLEILKMTFSNFPPSDFAKYFKVHINKDTNKKFPKAKLGAKEGIFTIFPALNSPSSEIELLVYVWWCCHDKSQK